jgi:hypothetical protein
MLSSVDWDDYGYYSVGSRPFINKYDALANAKERHLGIKFHWNDEFWGSQDWLKPTDKSLPDLYEERARALRDKYDYLILCFSGGADSWNILDTFDRHNIHLDEIVTYHDYGFTQDEGSVLNEEVFKVAIPRANDFISRHPRTKHTLIDSKEVLTDYYQKHTTDQSLQGYFGLPLTFSQPVRRGYWYFSDQRFRRLDGKNVAIVWGHDKPTLTPDPAGRRCFSFRDHFVYTKRKYVIHEGGVVDEYFYWSKSIPELLIKQCHVLKDAADKLNVFDPNVVLYPRWDATTFSQAKPRCWFFQDQDFFITDHLSEDIAKKWLQVFHYRSSAFQKIPLLTHTRPYYVE